MKVFVTGVNGQLGHDVINELVKRGYEAFGTDIVQPECFNSPFMKIDITDQATVMDAVKSIHPDAIIHCAASPGCFSGFVDYCGNDKKRIFYLENWTSN